MHQSTSVRQHRKARLWILGILIMIVGTSLLATQLLTHTPATPANHVPQEGLLSENLSPFLPPSPSATIFPLPSATPTPPPVILYISGAVFAPGVYMLPANARLYDVVLVAGGLTNHADTTRINLAAYIYDADHIHIPYKGEALPPDYAPITDVADPAQTAADLININIATADELEKLKGIGKVIANRIIAYRLSHGEFSSLEDLQNIQGISAAMVDELSASLTVGQ